MASHSEGSLPQRPSVSDVSSVASEWRRGAAYEGSSSKGTGSGNSRSHNSEGRPNKQRNHPPSRDGHSRSHSRDGHSRSHSREAHRNNGRRPFNQSNAHRDEPRRDEPSDEKTVEVRNRRRGAVAISPPEESASPSSMCYAAVAAKPPQEPMVEPAAKEEVQSKSKWVVEDKKAASKEKEKEAKKPLPEHYLIRDLNDNYTIPVRQEEWIKSIGGIMSTSNEYKDIKRKLKERAEFYIKKYLTRDPLEVIERQAQAIFLHLSAKRDNEKILQDMMSDLRRSMSEEKFNVHRDYLVNSIFNCYTPLDDAAYNGARNCLQLLVIWGAKPDRLNFDGETLEDTIRKGMHDLQVRNPPAFMERKRNFEACLDFMAKWRAQKKKQDEAAANESNEAAAQTENNSREAH